MKTLVIHPEDPTTDFLSTIYEGHGWTLLRSNPSHNYLKQLLKEHDRIIMLGHGHTDGLYYITRNQDHSIASFRLIINSSHVYLLREKECVCIWCNADEFVKKYNLKGFYTGMIISEVEEAYQYCLYDASVEQITESNTLFAESAKKAVTSNNMLAEMKNSYTHADNPIVRFNMDNLFERTSVII